MNRKLFLHIAFSTFIIYSLLMNSCSSGRNNNYKNNFNTDYQLSLAQWSLHRTFFGVDEVNWHNFNDLLYSNPDSLLQGNVKPIDFPKVAAEYGFTSIELVNYFYFDKAEDYLYWSEFKKQCEEAGVSVGLIMCDRIGNLGDVDSSARQTAIENHYKWVSVTKFLGAHSLRVNAAGNGSAEEIAENVVHSLSVLGEFAATEGINIIVENHGGYTSIGEWLASVIKSVNLDNVGTLPDFGNFCTDGYFPDCKQEYDKYKGMKELMPYAFGVSAKSHDFDSLGNEVHTDFYKMMKIVKESGYEGFIGIEYEGNILSEHEGILASKALLEKVFNSLNTNN